jgi:putative heme-binding domain-containing protein
VDVTGDGSPELVCIYQGGWIFARPKMDDPTAAWEIVRLSPDRGYGRYTHGQGVGDVDGDGRMDVIETNGWWQQPADWQPGQSFEFHAAKFAEAGGADMFAYDVDGDGDNDVISSQNAHAYGLSWYEQQVENGERRFVEHRVMGEDPEDFPHGVAFSQLHALALADMDGDGVQDLVTGKRYWAHGGNDPGAHGLPVLYWFQIVRKHSGVEFVPHLIDERSGVGTQVMVGDVDGDDDLDVVVGSKLGIFVLRHQVEQVQQDAATDAEPTSDRARHPGLDIGGDAFASGVRPTEWLSPEEEQKRFVLPSGFEIQLFAAEPQIAKPLNMAFDGRGRLWITDTVEYPYAAPPDRDGRDTIKILEDADGDGRAEKVTTFADGLNIPMGLYPYRDGVIAFSIPNIVFLRDTDRDDRADERTVLYGPFDHTRDVHGLCNAFRRGFDGWLYACHGFNNQSQVSGKDGNTVTMHSGNTFRMRPGGERIEHFAWGQVNPFGMDFDTAGNIFTADCHTKPITLLLAGGYYESFGKPHDGLGFVPPVMNHLHGSTAIGGIAVYDGDNFPPEYSGSTFGGNVMTSRVNRNKLVYEGASVTAHEEPDFVISGDPWFRPSDLRVGPDGALYIADFYNKIIGHYEVPLEHPGRDRTSGRIWRVVYSGREGSGAPSKPAPALIETNLAGKSSEELLTLLDSANLTQRLLIADRLVDHFGAAAVEPARRAFETSVNPTTRAQAVWVLHRLGALDGSGLERALADADPLVRTHAFHVLPATEHRTQQSVEWIHRGLNDGDALVRRAAVMAATRIHSEQLLDPLADLFFATPEADVHLRHAARMALRDHLRNDGWLTALSLDSLEQSRAGLVAGICLALDSSAAADFVAAYVERYPVEDRSRLALYVEFAAGRVGQDRLDTIARLVQDQFAGDRSFQLQLLEAVRSGLARREEKASGEVHQWAVKLATELLHLDKIGNAPLSWSVLSSGRRAARGNPWVVQLRASADGATDALFFCSLPNGEQLTGTYRSASFVLPEALSFYVAGHAGFPNRPAHSRNAVRLRDAASDEVLLECLPPRNDTAHRVEWDTSRWKGRPAVVELIDGDSSNAYAWLAAGRFSVDRLNPSHVPLDRQSAANLIGSFQLVETQDALEKVLLDCDKDAHTAKSIAEALVALSPDPRMGALCEVFAIDAGKDLEDRVAVAVLEQDREASEPLLGELMAAASAPAQLRIAQRLCSDRHGIEALLTLIEVGRASPQLLLQPSIGPRIEAARDAAIKSRAAKLVQSAAPPDEAVGRLLDARRAAMAPASTDAPQGAEVFRKHCANCHQLAGEGSKVGPQLDGIGNRGLDRILEDVLDVNRNVDVAFRTTTIATEAGRIVSGILLREEEQNLVLADQEGKELTIAKDEVEVRQPSSVSLMPANFGEVLSEQQLLDLAAFLARQR